LQWPVEAFIRRLASGCFASVRDCAPRDRTLEQLRDGQAPATERAQPIKRRRLIEQSGCHHADFAWRVMNIPEAIPNSEATPAPATPPAVNTPMDSVEVSSELEGDLFAQAPGFMAATRIIFEEILTTPDVAVRQEKLGQMYVRLHAVVEKAKLGQLEFASRAGSSLEALLKRLTLNARIVSPSILNSVANALNVLEQLLVHGVEQNLVNRPPFKILVVEDEELARRTIMGTLQLAFEKPDCAKDGAEALNLAMQKTYDVIFSDVEMPLMGGFGLCSRIRQEGPNQNTPVIFVTTHIDSESRNRATESGGTDFLGKPFLPIEINVKALTYALKGRLDKINDGPG
jgi:CheY-like chemotaxis protein